MTASPSGDDDSMSVDGSECRRSDMTAKCDEDCLHFLDRAVVVITAGGGANSCGSELALETTVALESWGTPNNSHSNAEAGSMRSDISRVKPS